MKAGAAIYAEECSACHTPGGTGIPGLFPALAATPAVQSVDPASTIRVVLTGAQSIATAAAPTAPVLTYIRNAWGDAASKVTASDVLKLRDALAKGD
jgi:mono/diheme cytochrome c family protein